MAEKVLNRKDIEAGLAKLPGWTLCDDGQAIECKFLFQDFTEAFAFMTRVALVAEKLDHHPEWKNVYKTVEVRLSTHDAGGVTKLDMELARRMNTFAGQT